MDSQLVNSTHHQLQFGMKMLHKIEEELEALKAEQAELKEAVVKHSELEERIKMLRSERKEKFEFMKSSIRFYEETTGTDFAEEGSLFDKKSIKEVV
ncbi:MAG: hypothetical protein K9J12_12470 [Melioribacteraceae bacterium]|nr:hypothetical protein [Melioribacteraceae bacterium]MCF8265836.1 hypothetical protein [Melioribacteraceae bacterium]MCF8414532.1 hypothetical protein [Melioribacteraceae bacterium]